MDTGYDLTERDGARLKLVRDPLRPLALPEGLALGALLPHLLRLNRRLVDQPGREAMLDAVAEAAVALTHGSTAHLFDLADDADPRAVTCRPEDSGERPSLSVAREVVRTGRAVQLYDAGEDDRFGSARSVAGGRMRSVLCVPLLVDGVARGALQVVNGSAPGLLTAEDVFLVEALADQAALALEVARLQHHNQALAARLTEQLAERTEQLETVRSRLADAEAAQGLRYRYDRIVHQSEGMRQVLELVDRVTDSDLPVLIIGESGTGKELLARAVHFNGARQAAPFVAVNCGAIAGTLFESEFFGHQKGAFTGADRARRGHFEEARGGTLFLDEVGELDLAMQVKLLRVLQEGEVVPVGSSRPVPVDVRIVAATNRPLEQMVREGTFRQDLYYRIGVVRIDVPPLRTRREDILPLAARFIEELQQRRGVAPFQLTDAVARAMQAYDWPGNIRELENAVSYLSIFAQTGLDRAPLPFLRPEPQPTPAAPPAPTPSAQDAGLWLPDDTPLAAAERALIEHTLSRLGGNRGQAAAALGIDRATLYRKLKAWEDQA